MLLEYYNGTAMLLEYSLLYGNVKNAIIKFREKVMRVP